MAPAQRLVPVDQRLQALLQGPAGTPVELALRCKAELGWRPRLFDLGGGLGVRQSLDETFPEPEEFARGLVERLRARWPEPALCQAPSARLL